MKWPQYGCQRKLVMILIMILLCLQQVPVLFNMYTDKDSSLIRGLYEFTHMPFGLQVVPLKPEFLGA